MRATYVERSKSKSEKGDGASDVAKGVSALTLEAKPDHVSQWTRVAKVSCIRLKLCEAVIFSYDVSYMVCQSTASIIIL